LNPVNIVPSKRGSLSILVISRRSSGTVGGRNFVRNIVPGELGAVLAGESEELVAPAALGNLDAILVGPLLDLGVAPGVEESVREALSGGISRGCGCRGEGG
jgi:hypothetical protein